MTDLLVIGGGAAGLMAAGAACAKGLTVTVLEHNPKGPGQKLLITGKGRCNVTSDSDVREFLPYVRHNGRFLYSSLYAFPPASAMQLFEELGVPLKTERGRRVFPQSDRAADVLAALRDYARNAEFVRGSAKKLLLEDGVCKGAVTDRGETLRAENTLIATGGISYPATGSDGSGYKLARQAGHTIVTPQPSLCSLISPDPACRRMMGLALRNVRLTLLCDGKELFTEQGEALFTHFGLSGPLVLSASTYIEDIAKHRYICEFDLKPALDEKTLYDPHTWLDPEKAGEEAQIIADKLSEVDSEHKETYQKNAQAFIKKAQELTKKFQPKFEKATQKTFVTQHTAFSYLAKRFGLNQLGIAGISPEQEPSPRQLTEIQEFVKTYKVKTIFTESNASSKVAETLVKSTGVGLKTLNPLEADPQNDKTYLENLEDNMSILAEELK